MISPRKCASELMKEVLRHRMELAREPLGVTIRRVIREEIQRANESVLRLWAVRRRIVKSDPATQLTVTQIQLRRRTG